MKLCTRRKPDSQAAKNESDLCMRLTQLALLSCLVRFIRVPQCEKGRFLESYHGFIFTLTCILTQSKEQNTTTLLV